jgi:benzodiazapine receptor
MSSRAALAAFVAVTFLAPLAGAVARPDAWYFALARPAWTPPPWLFGPVWTLLYLMMAVAAWMVWKRAGTTRPLEWWTVQLMLNAAWSPVFFGLHRLGLAVIVIAALWLAIAATIRAFAAVDRRAAWLLAPYLAWVSYATALNVAIWQMNR